MKIFGIGTDIINIKRMEKTLKKDGGSFKKKVFSQNEIIYCEKKKYPTQFFAKRFDDKLLLNFVKFLYNSKLINESKVFTP